MHPGLAGEMRKNLLQITSLTDLPFQGGYAWCGYFKPQAMPEAELIGAFSPGKKRRRWKYYQTSAS
jgi:hypothetical protein